MIETNSFNWFTPKTPEVQNDFDVAEKIDENHDVSYQTTYENPPVEVNQTVPLSFSDVQEIAANSSFKLPQDEWSVAEKDEENPSETNQHDNLKVDEARRDNQNEVETTNEKGFDFEPSSIPKDEWRFDDASDNSWKISPPKPEIQQSDDLHLSEVEKSQFDEPKIIDFDATMEIKDEDKPLEYRFEDDPQGFKILDSTETGNSTENDDWYKPQTQQNKLVTENAILELDDNKPFDFSFKDDDSILDLFQESQVIRTEVSDNEPEMEVNLDDERFSANPYKNDAQPFTTGETTFEPAIQPTDDGFAFANVEDAKEAGEKPRNFQTQEDELPESEITSRDSETQSTQVRENQALTTSNFELLSPISQNNEIEKTNERQISQTREDSFANFYFTPEIIDAIAQRVVERISDKVIEKIAWEIVPDRFDLIVKKQIEERNRDS
ncbi:MAG: hypothetical protein H7Z37_16355 [Pyrinomonadaceae bacterium]|nr:hypothetical protein [Pyrinomonadaceae bacterium]